MIAMKNDGAAVVQIERSGPLNNAILIQVLTVDETALNITFTMAIISHGDVAVLSNATITIVDNDHGELTI